MSAVPVGGGFVASCPCGWRTFSQTKAVVQQRLAEHQEGCK